MKIFKQILLIIPTWRLLVTIFLLVLPMIMVFISNIFHLEKPRQGEYFTERNKLVDFLPLIAVISCFLCFFVLYCDVTPAQYLQLHIADNINNGEELSARIETISNDLAESAKELDAIQEQLESRIATVEELKKEAEIAENMISLSEEQVSAIQSKLNQELEASSGKSFWVNVFVSAFFFTLGLIVTPVFNFIRRRLQKTPPQKPIAGRDGLTEEELEKFHRMLDKMARNEFTRVPK